MTSDKSLTPAQARQKIQKALLDCLAGNDQGSIVFRLKRIKHAGSGTQVIGFSRTELNKLHDETGQAAMYARSTQKSRLMSMQRQAIKFYEEEVAGVFETGEGRVLS